MFHWESSRRPIASNRKENRIFLLSELGEVMPQGYCFNDDVLGASNQDLRQKVVLMKLVQGEGGEMTTEQKNRQEKVDELQSMGF